MKLYVLFLSFLLAVIVPINAYAIFPFALGASTAGRIVLTKAGGYAIKKLAPNALKNLITNAGKLCFGSIGKSMLCGFGLQIPYDKMMEENNVTINNNGDTINIYRTQNVCYTTGYYQSYANGKMFATPDALISSLEGFTYVESAEYTKTLSNVKKIDDTRYYALLKSENAFYKKAYPNGVDSGGVVISVPCSPDLKNKYVSDDDIYNYVVKYITDDDIKNIYNYDYSQHNNLTINGDKFSGDKVNGDKNSFDESETKNITNKLGDKIINKKYDADDVNDTNCDKNESGEYDNCGDDRNNTDDISDSSTPPTNTPKDPDTDNPGDEPPIECNANGFYKKVCDWMDWTQKDYDKPTDTKIEVTDKTKDLPQLKQDRISFSEQCPPPKKFTLSAMGLTKELEISYQQYCDFFIAFKPFSIPLSTFGAILIIAGVGRKDG